MFTVARNRVALSLALCCLIQTATAQLSYHTDANSNSFTLKTPSLQQSFSRYFGGAGGQKQKLLAQPEAAASQQQPVQAQQFSQAFGQQFAAQQQTQAQGSQSFPSLQSSDYGPAQYQHSPYMQRHQSPSYASQREQAAAEEQYAETLQRLQQRQQMQQRQLERLIAQEKASRSRSEQMNAAYYAYQQQQQQYAEQQRQYQEQLLTQLYRDMPPTKLMSQATPMQSQTAPMQSQSPKIYTTDQYANFLAQQHMSVLHQQHNQLEKQYASSVNFGMPKAITANDLSSTVSPYSSPLADPYADKLLGMSYSPSDKVSHVKFTSGSLNYNF